MNNTIRESAPIYVLIAEAIKDHILSGEFKEGDQLPSTTVIAKDYNLSIPTANKGISLVVAEGLVHKKRGIGMFVSEGAVEKLIEQRRAVFKDNYVKSLLTEARRLRYSVDDLQKIVADVYKEMND